jgi:spermidine synthase
MTRYRFWLLLLFAGSGCAALVYEIVWFQLLTLAIGSTTISMAVLLSTFMGGLCLGSIALPRLRTRLHPLRIYAFLEIGIAACGLLVLFALPYINRVYISGAEHGMPNMLLRGVIAAICMLPPTVLMGASLPAIVRWLESTPEGVTWWGFLYGGNTAGAVLGCLVAGFYLLRLYSMPTATYAAVAVNLMVAALSLVIAPRAGAPAAQTASLFEDRPPRDWTVYVAIALSGATALGAEVVWTRLMGMMLGATVYVFSIILAVFLVGLALGSAAGSWLLRRVNARAALGASQLLLVLGIAWAAFMIVDSIPYWNTEPLLSGGPWLSFRLDLLRCFCALLPATIFWGASFPLACAAVARPGEDSGRVVGGVYAANTLGAIFGALLVSLILIPGLGTQQTQRLLLLFAFVSAFVVLIAEARRGSIKIAGLLAASALVTILLIGQVHVFPGKVIAYGRRMAIWNGTVLYTAEGINSSVAISRASDGATEVDVNGHVEATTESYDMKLQRMVGHLPGLLHPHPVSVLGIGFGAGVSAGTFTRYPTIQKITVCEIEPAIPPASTRYFAREDYDVLHNPRTRIVYDDARHYLMTTPETFDIIASDPLDVFVKGTAALYTKEYFDAVKRHLNPGGMFSLYVPLYETDEETIKSELATFFEAFPYGSVWANTVDGQGYDMVFMGQNRPLHINLDEVQQRLEQSDYQMVAQSLQDIGVGSAADLFSTYTGGKSDFAPWLRGAQINRDSNLRLQYLGGWGINSSMADVLYRKMLYYRRTPGDIFTGSPRQLQGLFYLMSADGSGTR